MEDTPRLPSHLPSSFGNDSPFPPPAVSSRNASAAFLSSASAPPLPPARDEALERERRLRQIGYQQPYASSGEAGPSFTGSLQPGQIIPRIAYARPVAASSQLPSPMLNAAPVRMPVPAIPRPPPKTPIKPRRAQQQQPSSSSPATQRPQQNQRKGRPSPKPSVPPPQQSSSSSSSNMYTNTPRLVADSGQSQRLHAGSNGNYAPPPQQQQQREAIRPPVRDTSSPSPSPELNVVLPDLNTLTITRDRAFGSANDKRIIAWCKDVIKYVERKSEGTNIRDPLLVQYIDEAIRNIDRFASGAPPLPEALYLRGDLQASGAFPAYHRKSLKQAFNDFELSARMGHAPSWFRIGRDYEILGDNSRAKDAYDRGCAVRDVGCVYRMGMANLLGQLGLAMNHDRAIPLLREAADLVNLDTPQPSYIYGMLLAGEFSHVEVAPRLLVPTPPATIESEAKQRIQRAAYLNFGPAQYRCGWSYEYALLDCPFDPLLSVQYYSLASQAGEVEADLALSKWFLCGAEGCFDKNEGLAFTFAEKAARKGLPSAEFAMGYYFEVGVGCRKSIDTARGWYKTAASHGNTDAKERLAALQGPTPSSLSRIQHEAHVDTQLQRKRTEAKVKSDRRSRIIAKERKPDRGGDDSRGGTPVQAMGNGRSTDVQRRRMTMRLVEETAAKKSYHPRRDEQGATSERDRGGSSRPAPDIAIGRSAGKSRTTPEPGASSKQSSRPAHSNGTRPPKQNGISASSSASTGLASKSNGASDYSHDKKFETFGEMGFNAKKTKDDKDCVIC